VRNKFDVTFNPIFADGTRHVLLARQGDAAGRRICISERHRACAKTGIGARGGRVFPAHALHFLHQNASKRDATMPDLGLLGRCGDRKIRVR
jgi:hypothetical protein